MKDRYPRLLPPIATDDIVFGCASLLCLRVFFVVLSLRHHTHVIYRTTRGEEESKACMSGRNRTPSNRCHILAQMRNGRTIVCFLREHVGLRKDAVESVSSYLYCRLEAGAPYYTVFRRVFPAG